MDKKPSITVSDAETPQGPTIASAAALPKNPPTTPGAVTGRDVLDFLAKMHGKLIDLKNIELEILWHRATFFCAIIGLLLTGYGYALVELLVSGKGFQYASRIVCPITAVGFLFAYLWIWLFRGSKFWLGNYREALKSFVATFWAKRKAYLSADLAADFGAFMASISTEKRYEKMNISFFSMDEDAVSTTRVLILLGWIMTCIWAFLFVVHFTAADYIPYFYDTIVAIQRKTKGQVLVYMFFAAVAFFLITVFPWLVYNMVLERGKIGQIDGFSKDDPWDLEKMKDEKRNRKGDSESEQ